jgi:hypothetical protein
MNVKKGNHAETDEAWLPTHKWDSLINNDYLESATGPKRGTLLHSEAPTGMDEAQEK